MKLKIRNIELGSGRPKVIVPIVGKNMDEIMKQLKAIKSENVDMIEIRADFYEDLFDEDKLIQMLMSIRKEVTYMAIIFTIRTKAEGGKIDINNEDYAKLIKFVCDTNSVDIIDVEINKEVSIVKNIIHRAHQNNIYVISSSHNFDKTPSENELVCVFEKMNEVGSDILKVAVMPNCEEDILNLLKVTTKINKQLNKPIIAISMGSLGIISRISGQVFGSCATFASCEKSSAPGQINVKDMNKILDIINQIQ